MSKFRLIFKNHLYNYLFTNSIIGLTLVLLLSNQILSLSRDSIKGFLLCSSLSIFFYSLKISILNNLKIEKNAVKYQLFIFLIHFLANIIVLLVIGVENYRLFSGFLIAYFLQIIIFVITLFLSKIEC